MFLQLLTLLTLWSSLGSAHPLSGLASLSTPHFHQPHIFTRLRNGLGKMTPSSWRPVVPSPSHSPDASSYNSPKPSGTFRERYDRDLVLRFNISTEEEASSLAEAVDTLFLDVWEFTPASADIRLAKDVVPSLLGLLPKSMQRAHKPLMHDLAQTVYESLPSSVGTDTGYQPPPLGSRRSFKPSASKDAEETNIFFSDYQPLSVIIPWMRLIQSMFPTHVRIINIGTSYEGRDILGFRVGVHPWNPEEPQKPRKTIIVSGGLHAREWIGVSSVMFAAYSMITSYGKARKMTKLIEEFDWVFIPSLNPDGYVYTWETDRLWRKNAQQTSLRFCKGLDVDRSFGFQWDGERTKGNPCSESFAGDGPFQAVEAQRFANWVKNETDNNNAEIVGYLDLHSYSQQILYPYSYSCINTPPTLENLEEVGLGFSKAIHQAGGEFYGVTSACEGNVFDDSELRHQRKLWPRIESSGGTALDYMYHEMGVKYSYQIKLRDTGNYGFLLPKKNIVPTGKEISAVLNFFGNYLLGNKGVEVIDNSPSSDHVEIKMTKSSDPDKSPSSSNTQEEESILNDINTNWDLKR